CRNCGFVWQKYILDEDLMSELYDKWISPECSLKKQENLEDLMHSYTGECRTVIKMLSKSPNRLAMLDFGMGWGNWCLAAKRLGCNVTGYEISEERTQYARKHGIDVVNNLDDIKNLEFDFINCEQVMEHIPNPLATLKILAAKLKDNGILRISVPNGAKIEKELKNDCWKASKNAIHPLEHINCFEHKTLKRLAESASLNCMMQPHLLIERRDSPSRLKGVIGTIYRQFFGTTLYFRKSR
ncbi:MAG: class I SAM-dependent methyltransferase, partial [Candidatus Gracilibacteria bacterium]